MSGKAPIGALPQHLVRGTGVCLAAVVTQWVSLTLWDHARDSQIIWLPGPLLLALLLSTGYRYWFVCNLGWFAGMLLVTVMLGLPVPGIAAISALVIGLIDLVAWILCRLRKDQSIDNFFQLLVFLAIAVAALPTVTGTLIAWFAEIVELPSWLSREWWHVALSD